MADVKLNDASARTRGQLSGGDGFVVIPAGAGGDSGAASNAPERIAWSELTAEMAARSGLDQTAVDARIRALIAVDDVVKAASFDTSTHELTLTQNDNTDITVDLSSLATTSSGGATSFAGLSGNIAITQIPDNLITEAKLESGVRTKLNNRGEDNVQADWNQSNASDDAFIRNKPTIPTALSQLSGSVGEDNVQSDWNETDTNDDAFIRNKPTIPTAETGATIKGKLEGLSGSARLDASAVKNLPSGGGGSGEQNVQADWNETDTTDDSFIKNKPTIPTALSQLSGTVTDGQIPSGITRDTELAGSITQLKGAGLPANRDTMKELSDAIDAINPGEDNVQADWNEARTNNDAFIRNKPTIPSAETAAGIKTKLETLTGNARLDASAVKNLPTGGGSSAFDLYADTGTETTALADADRFVIGDVSETGEPNRYLTAVNARKYLKGWRGEWSNLTQNTDKIYVGDLLLHNSGYYLCKTEHLRGALGPDGDSDRFARLDNETLAAAQNTDVTEWFAQAVTINTASRLTALPSPNPTIPENGLMIISWFDRGASVTESSPIVIPCERLRGLTARSANDDVSSNSAANVIRAAIFPGDSARRAYASFGRTSTHKLLIAVDDASDDPAPLKVWHMPAAGTDFYHYIDATAGDVTLTAAQVQDLQGKFVNVDTGGNVRTITFTSTGLTGHVCFTVTNCNHDDAITISGGGSLSSYNLQPSGSGFVVASSTEFWVERFARSIEANTRGSIAISTQAGNDQAYILGLANSGVDPVHLNADTDAEKRAFVDKIDAIKVHDLSSGNATLSLNAVDSINGKVIVVDSNTISNRDLTFTNAGMTGRAAALVVNKGTASIAIKGRNSGITSTLHVPAGKVYVVILAADVFSATELGGGQSFDLYQEITTQVTGLARGDRFVVSDVSDTGQPNKYILATNARRYFKGYLGSWGSLASNLLIEVGDITEHSSAWYISIRQHTKSSTNPGSDTTNWIRIDRNSSTGGASAFSQLTGQIALNQIPDNILPASKIAENAIGNSELQDDAVYPANLRADTDAQKQDLIARLGFPRFPATGSRNNKTMKFENNVLKWLEDTGGGGGSSAATEWFNANVTVTTANTLVALPSPNPTIPENGLLIVYMGAALIGIGTPQYTFSNSIVIPAEHLRGLTAHTAGTVVDTTAEAQNTVRVYADVNGRLQAIFARTSANKLLFSTSNGFDPKPLRIWHVPTGGGGEDFDLWEISRSATELHDIDRVVFGDSRSTGNPNTWINAANARKFFKGYRGEWGNLTQNTDRIYIGDVLLHNGGYFFCKSEHLRGGSGPDGDSTNFTPIETYWGVFRTTYDYQPGRIVWHDGKFWINNAAVTSSDPLPGAAGNTKWIRIDGGGSSTSEPIVKEISANTTYYLNDNWDDWKNQTVLIYSNGSDPTVTIEPDSGAKLWEPGSELTEQAFSLPAGAFYTGSDNITLEPTPAQRVRFTNSKFSTGNRYPARVRMWDDGRADILFADDATTSTGSLGRSDMSDAFEVNGHVTVKIDSDQVSFAMGASDRTEPYALSGLNQDFRDFVDKFKVAGNNSKASTLYFSILDTTDVDDELGSKLTIQPMWQDGEVQLKYFDFARHQSDGDVRTFSKSGTATNATEGEGMPFEMIFANNLYFAGSTGKKWFVNPLTQNVDGVIAGWARRDNILTKVPASLLPHGHGGQVVGTFVAQSSNFRMVKASHPINARITTAAHPSTTVTPFVWDIQTNELAQVYNGRDEKLEVPYKRRVQNQNGYFLQAVRAADDAVTSEAFIPFDMSGGTELRFIDSDGNLADLEFYAVTTNNQSAGGAFRLLQWAIDPNEQFWIEWNAGTGPNWTAKFADDEFFYIKVYEWIDSAAPIAQSSGGSAQGQGAFDLRREEDVTLNLSGTSVDVGGSTGFRVDENATHLDIEITTPSNLTPNGIIWHYQLPGDNTWHDLYDENGDRFLLYRSQTKSYRFNSSFFHVSGGRNYVKTRLTSSTAMSGTLNLTLKHEEDVNSATIEPLTLLESSVVVPTTALNANLSGATLSDVDFDVPVEYDQLISITVYLSTTHTNDPEQAEIRFNLTKDEIDSVGTWTSSDSVASQNAMKGWYGYGNGGQGSHGLSSWRARPKSAYAYYWSNQAPNTVSSRFIALSKTGAYLDGLKMLVWEQSNRIDKITCLRKI